MSRKNRQFSFPTERTFNVIDKKIAHQREACDQQEVQRLLVQLDATKRIGQSRLDGTFQSSRGFGVVFTDEGLPQFRARFPFAEALLDNVESFSTQGNAFYFNALVVSGATDIGWHVDATLEKYIRVDIDTPIETCTPSRVSVLYLRNDNQGTISFAELSRESKEIVLLPTPGDIIHFQGDMPHRVHPPESQRISLVLEQYDLSIDEKSRVPRFAIDSHRTPFASSPTAEFDTLLRTRHSA